MSTKKYKIAVYGSLRKGMGNNSVINGATDLGTFQTNPVFEMYSLGGYPGLKAQGETSITMEAYEVDHKTMESVNALEGYSPGASDNNFYDRATIKSPYGDVYIYIYQRSVEGLPLVESGDWVDFKGK